MPHLAHLRSSLLRFGLVLLTALGAGAASAQGFGFAPTALNISAGGTLSTQTTMVNSGRAPAQFTVLVRAWKMVGGETVLEDTRDLIVNPTSFTLPAGGSQVIRVGLRKKPGAQELTYRVIVQQVPAAGNAEQVSGELGEGRSASLDLAIAFSLPVYVTPPGARSEVQASVGRDGDALILALRNVGGRRATYNNLVVRRSGEPLAVPSYAVLAGAEYALRLPGLADQSGPLLLTYRNADGQEVRETLAVP